MTTYGPNDDERWIADQDRAAQAAIPAEVLSDLEAAEAFEEAAAQAVEITERTLARRKMEVLEANLALERAANSKAAADRALTLAGNRLVSLRRAEGVVRTADGYELARTP